MRRLYLHRRPFDEKRCFGMESSGFTLLAASRANEPWIEQG
jgi:hypothetical protein